MFGFWCVQKKVPAFHGLYNGLPMVPGRFLCSYFHPEKVNCYKLPKKRERYIIYEILYVLSAAKEKLWKMHL
jgi:hypothetical protein